jgi:hypothetical protein
MMSRRLVVSALATGLIAAGCGGNDDADGDAIATSDLSRQQWVAQANKICSDLDGDTDRRAEQFFSGENATEMRFVRRVVAPGLERWASELQQLGAPRG